MSRIRTIKPDFWCSEQIISCSHSARLLFIGLLNFADDHGVHPASTIRLKAEVFPSDSCANDEVKKWVVELVDNGLLREYEIEGKSYWLVTGWKNHQRIDRPTYKYPLPACQRNYKNSIIQNLNSRSTLRVIDEHSTTTLETLDESSTTEWKGMEGIGDKEKICEAEASLVDISANKLIATNEVRAIFSHWQEVMRHPQAKLDGKRQRKIEAALKLGFSVEQLKQAIDGCARTPFNIGVNDRSQRYDGVDLIFRGAENIERFMAAASNATSSLSINNANSIFAGVI